jgi:two-component system cell cycle response regulator DivK
MTSPPPNARDSGVATAVPLVLIVDDNEKNRKLARDVLRAAGLRTLEAASGGEGIALAAERLPDVILLDLRLPDMDGTDIARTLRDGARTARIPVVALSAQRYAGDSDRLLAAGFAGYLEKPIDVGEFPEQVRSYCGPVSAWAVGSWAGLRP